MCDSTTYAQLEGIITDLVINAKPFTAFDVTKSLRSKGNQIAHWEVKNDIHKIASNTSYTRTAIDINGNEAFLYHPQGADITNYVAELNATTQKVQPPQPQTTVAAVPQVDPIAKVVNSIFSIINPAKVTPVAPQSKPSQAVVIQHVNGKLQPVTLGNSITQVAQTDKIISLTKQYGTDKRGRLWIPSTLVSKIGAAISSKVNVSVVNNKIEVSVQPNPNATYQTSYTVDKSQNVAISENVFKAAGLSGQGYKISESGSKLVVEKA